MTPAPAPAESAAATKSATPTSRRSFFTKLLAVGAGGLAVLTPLAMGVWAWTDPLWRRRGAGTLVRVAPLNKLPLDGPPQKFEVVADRIDAWNFFPQEPVGAVYLRRTGADQVEALSAVCPHAGCLVDFDASANCYRCPCHNSSFTLTGAIVQPSPSPRPMDTLAVEIRNTDDAEHVWIKFESFYAGIAEKVPRA